MPPETSTVAAPATIATAAATPGGAMLSRRMTSAPDRTAWRTSPSVLASTSMRARWGAPALARATALAREPAAAMWLSLIRTCSPRELRWLRQPPQRTAYFSSARNPGVVLRVSTMRIPGPGLSADTASPSCSRGRSSPHRRWKPRR